MWLEYKSAFKIAKATFVPAMRCTYFGHRHYALNGSGGGGDVPL